MKHDRKPLELINLGENTLFVDPTLRERLVPLQRRHIASNVSYVRQVNVYNVSIVNVQDVRNLLTDANGKPTHVVLTVLAFQDMEELIEDLQEFQDFHQMRDKEEMIPWEEAKRRLGLQD